MTWLLPEQLAALKDLEEVCARLGTEVVIIGAAAYQAWFADPGRHTADVDVAVGVDLDEFSELAEALTRLGWRQEPRREHRWNTPAGARIDLLPAGPKLRAAGRIEWPQSGMSMNMAGFEHVFAEAEVRHVAPGSALRVIPVPVLALLKITSFLDSPYARAKDAQDIFSILDRYEIDGERRFASEVFDAGIDYQRAGAFLLGKDVAALCTAAEADLVMRFVRSLQDESTAEALIVARTAISTSFEEQHERRRAALAAFAAGFSNDRSAPG